MLQCTVHDRSITVPFILDQTGFMRVHITGSSMEPTIRRNDVIEVRRNEGIRPGNCYLFLFDGVLLLHRCISCAKTTGYFMGDSSGSIEAVENDSVLAEFNDPHSRLFCRAVTLLNSLSACPYRNAPLRMPRSINCARINIIRLMHRIDGIFSSAGRVRTDDSTTGGQ